MVVVEAEKLLTDSLRGDIQTLTHCRRVAIYSVALCGKLELDEQETLIIRTAALLHDIGKRDIPREILEKTTLLTAQEETIVKQHSTLGHGILEQKGQWEPILSYILHHHERMDGSGYPAGLMNKKIPFGARIIALTEAFDAMTSKRTYTAQKSFPEALEEIQRCSGTQFDEKLVGPFVELVMGSMIKKA